MVEPILGIICLGIAYEKVTTPQPGHPESNCPMQESNHFITRAPKMGQNFGLPSGFGKISGRIRQQYQIRVRK